MKSRKALPIDNELSDWRVRRLTAAGFSPREAYELAIDDRVDLHAVLELIDRGCPPPLAVRITAPLEDGQARCVSATSATSESCSSRQAEQPSR
jgi:spore coat polysaccharide biosynthesis protein SpsF (cytidylyltransferase family)